MFEYDRMLFVVVIGGLVIASAPTSASAPQIASSVSATIYTSSAEGSVNSGVQQVQACGWYAISVCSRTYDAAQEAADRFGGYVIDTNSPEYPNFRGGWFCAVIGPKTRSAARSTARQLRNDGASSAYAKSAC